MKLRSFPKNIKKLVKKIVKPILWRGIFPSTYRYYRRQDICNNKILFIEPASEFSINFQCLYSELTQSYKYEVHIHELRDGHVSYVEYLRRCIRMIKDISTARYVFIDEACSVLGHINFREGTVIVQTWHACGAFKKFGFSTADLLFGSDMKEKLEYPAYNFCSFVTVSSPEVIWAYSEAMNIAREKILPLGISRTDVFFDKEFLSTARKNVESKMPDLNGRKIILFAPTFRGRVKHATTATAFSVEDFYRELSDKYVLIIKHHPHIKNPPEIPEEYKNFAIDMTNSASIEELLCVADICISDYSSLIFEYSLFERPMLFFDYDIDEYYDWRGFYYKYDDFIPGPEFKTNEDMIDYIKHIDERFDREKVIEFKNKFMSSCDGHSTQRIIDKMLSFK